MSLFASPDYQLTTPAFRCTVSCSCFHAYRFSLQLLSPSSILAKTAGRSEITTKDVAEANELFMDARRSAKVLTATSETAEAVPMETS